ncbi:MAG: carbamoyltransferase [Pseudomonadota bacterium]
MNILGISCFYHDAAACLVQDGEIIAAAQEERFSRIKHDPRFPIQTIEYCLGEAELTISDIDYVVFYEKPILKFERLLENYLAVSPLGIHTFVDAMSETMTKTLQVPSIIKKKIGWKGPVLFTDHHQSHAGAAFFPSPFQNAAILTIDGVGEWTTTSISKGSGNRIEKIKEINYPHSLGLLYSAFTAYTGFRVNFGEYKLMGLAPYGEPKYVDQIKNNLIEIYDNGSFRLNLDYFTFPHSFRMTNEKFNQLFDGPPRTPEGPVDKRIMDVARSIQEVTEEVMLKLAQETKKITGEKNLCLAGGVALNCVGNGKILKSNLFDQIWIQPAAGDAGGSLGAALYIWHEYLNNPRQANDQDDFQKASLLGPSFSEQSIKNCLSYFKAPATYYNDDELFNKTADLIAQEKVVGWFQGRMEFGPRALGSRSILGDARSEKMQTTMNLKIKFRESFRPFAPTVLAEKAEEFFDINCESPYMLLVADVNLDKRLAVEKDAETLQGLDKLHLKRSIIPAVTHVDYSARLQTVSAKDNPRYHALINKFYEKTGCPVIINTSFNVRGEPIVCSPFDAYRCFMRTEMDYLVLGNYILDKKNQPELDQKEKDFQVELD